MRYYSTNKKAPMATLHEAVVKGLASDRGLYMPERIKSLPSSFFDNIDNLSFQDIACTVADAFFGEDIPADDLRRIVCDTLAFDCPVVKVDDNIYALELFHGPTLAFKDVGARFMARLLQYFIRQEGQERVNVLVATSGDTGSAVANGFLGVEGIHVYVLYPKGKVSKIQECQFTTLGQNITAIEVDGVFDDCQALVKQAFLDPDLNAHMRLTSANSINVARFLPQAFYYFNAYARMKALGKADNMVMCVPSGNFGNITAGLFGHVMGLPIRRFIAANNANNIFYQYLQTGVYTPQPTKQTLANAMDVGDRATLPGSTTSTEAATMPSLLISAEPPIPTTTSDRPCANATAAPDTYSTHMVHADTAHCASSCERAKLACSARRHTLPNSRKRSTISSAPTSTSHNGWQNL